MKENGWYTKPICYNGNRCVDSLRLNIDRDFKHLMSYGRAFQYLGAITHKADSE